jgi:hypothetical protein
MCGSLRPKRRLKAQLDPVGIPLDELPDELGFVCSMAIKDEEDLPLHPRGRPRPATMSIRARTGFIGREDHCLAPPVIVRQSSSARAGCVAQPRQWE